MNNKSFEVISLLSDEENEKTEDNSAKKKEPNKINTLKKIKFEDMKSTNEEKIVILKEQSCQTSQQNFRWISFQYNRESSPKHDFNFPSQIISHLKEKKEFQDEPILQNYLIPCCEQLKQRVILLAVVGSDGVGKSFFINQLLRGNIHPSHLSSPLPSGDEDYTSTKRPIYIERSNVEKKTFDVKFTCGSQQLVKYSIQKESEAEAFNQIHL